MDIEEIHALLKGASDSDGANFDVTLRWFKRCEIVDEKAITTASFTRAYERLAPNREDLSLSQLIVLLAIFSRETKTELEVFSHKFETVKDIIIEEIQERIREQQEREAAASVIVAVSEESLMLKRIKFS